MLWYAIYRRYVNRTPSQGRRGIRLSLECLEDRLTPSSFTAATVSDLIADIKAANLAGGSNTITLAPNVTFDLTVVNNTTDGATGLPVIAAKDNLTINGQGGDILERDSAAPAFRLLDVAKGASLTLQNLTLQGGYAYGTGVSAEGGGIFNQGTLVLNSVTLQNNEAQGSAGANSKKKLAYAGNGNSAAGGGIYSSGSLTLENGTLVQNNRAAGGGGGSAINGYGGNGGDGAGGGLYVAGGAVSLTNTNLSNNGASGGSFGWGMATGVTGVTNIWHERGNPGNGLGGGLYLASGIVTLSDDTVDSNSANAGGYYPVGLGSGLGGGLYVASGTVNLNSDTVDYNSATDAGGGLFVAGGTVTLTGDTLEYNSAGPAGPIGTNGGGLYIANNASVCLDAFTLANTINNRSAVVDNIYGSYKTC
jgi:hypothetical protein